MTGIKKKSKTKKAARVKDDASKTKTTPPKPLDDDLYETGDIAAPERDRDDEQRDL